MQRDGSETFEFLLSAPSLPLLILSDMNMLRMNGIQFRLSVPADPRLRKAAIPFVFLTSSVSEFIKLCTTELECRGSTKSLPATGTYAA